MKKRIVSWLLVAVMLLGMLPTAALATGSGSVRVIVENTTCSTNEATLGCWQEGSTPWQGVLVNQWVQLESNSTAMSCVVAALGEGHTITGAENNYITEIDGLVAPTGVYSCGWMGTINDWFTNEGFGAYSVQRGTLSDGDEIRIMYTMNSGADLGSISNDTTKTLRALTVTGGTLIPSFSANHTSYQLALGEDVTSGSVTVTPTAYNKNFQVRVYKGEVYAAADAGYKRGQSISVSEGDTLQVVVGDPAWPSMNNGAFGGAENVPAGVYRICVVQSAENPSAAFDSFFTALNGVATVSNSENYPFQVTADGTALVSTNAGVNSSSSALTLTFSKAAELSFKFKTSSEATWDFLKISKNGTALNSSYTDKPNYSGKMDTYKDYSIQLAAGDELELAYSKDSSGDSGDDCVWLKDFTVALPYTVTFHANDGTEDTKKQDVFGTAALMANPFTRSGYRFEGWATTSGGAVAYADGAEITMTGNVDLYAVWTAVWAVTFPNMPAGASITVKQGDTVLAPEPDGSWLLPDGDYTYSASLFGYESVENVAFTVNGQALAIEAGLTSSARAAVSFSVSPANATVEVYNSENTLMTAEEGVYHLPAGSYTYTVKASGYKKAMGSFVVEGMETKTIPVTLEISNVWEGNVSKTEPSSTGGVYQIGTGAELAWFAQQVNESRTTISAVLTADILLNDPDEAYLNEWTPIGTTASAFAGSFDGAGHTITGVYITSGSTVGLFGSVAAAGSVSNLTLEKASVTGTDYVGAAAGQNAGEISGVLVKNSAVAGAQYVGGVAGKNTGVVTACADDCGTVTQHTAKDNGIGGVAGENTGTVSLCWNGSDLVRNHSSKNYGYFGGLVGKNSGLVVDCYNLGAVDEAYKVGGIVGYPATGNTITNCYNAGTIGKSSGDAICNASTGTMTNCYYLDGCGASSSNGTAKTADELKVLAPALGGSFENQTNGYPILKWQNPNATFTITLTVTPAQAAVSLSLNGTAVAPASTEGGVYTFTGLSAGSYAYSVTYEEGDYAPQTGSITIGKADVSKTVELEARRYAVTFTLTPADVSLTLKDSEDQVQEGTTEGGTVTYLLPNGTYSYTAEKFGYISQSGEITVNKAAVDRTVSLTQNTAYSVTFTGVPEGAVVTVTHATGGVQAPTAENTYSLVAGTYSYTVKKKGMETVRGEITVVDAPQEIPVSMLPAQPWDGSTREDYDGGSGTLADPYQIANGAQLYNLSYQVYTNGESGKYYILTDDIDMGRQSFLPIGCDTSHKFNGYFDGNGFTISNLVPCNDDDPYTGLFGYVSGGKISNVTLDGVVAMGANYVGALAGNLYSGSVEKCVARNVEIGGEDYVGGLFGYQYAQAKNCAVLCATVTGTGNYVGGVSGCGYEALKESYTARTTVTGSGDYTGGLVGAAYGSTANIEDCFVRGGSVSGNAYVGGLIGGNKGYSKAKLTRCYTTAVVSATASSFGQVAGRSNYLTLTNVYFSTDASCTGTGTALALGEGKLDAELKAADILSVLGDKFAIKADSVNNKYINAGYPYLTATYFEEVSPVILAAPSVSWNNKTAFWTEVANAGCYKVVLTKDAEELECFTTTELSRDFASAIDLGGSGSYMVSVSAIGDGEAYRNSAASTATVSFTVQSAEVTFAVTAAGGSFRGSDPQITVRMTDGTELTFTNNTAKTLPFGDYTYEVKAATFTTLTGNLTVGSAETQTIPLTMTYSSVWDGETTMQPTQTDGVYQITNGYELAWFRDQVNATVSGGSSSSLSAVLCNDVNLGGHAWTVIGCFGEKYGSIDTSATIGYTGTFDGNGKTISGLFADTDAQGSGLFGYIYEGACIKDLTVSGTMTCGQYAGGIVVAMGGGRIENCVSNVQITAKATGKNLMVGGIVGTMSYKATTGVVTGCVNNGIINCTGNSYLGGIVGNVSAGVEISNCVNNATIIGADRVAGIAGSNAGAPIRSCVNTGSITGTTAVGGIAGFTNKTLTDCYNTGAITGVSKASDGVGGIAGRLNGKYGGAVDGSYNIGTITDSGVGICGAIAGTKGTDSSALVLVTRSYYLENTCTQGIGSDGNESEVAGAVSEAELKMLKMTAVLGGQFASLNSGDYPVLKWQNAAAKYVTAFDVTPTDAAVTVKQGEQTVSAAAAGAYFLEDGEYTYSVSKTKYNTATGTIAAAGASQLITLVLEAETFPVSFSVTPEGAKITVYNSENQVVSAGEGGYSLPNGRYTYTVEKFGYETVNGDFTVADGPVTVPTINLTALQRYAVTFAPAFESGTEPETYSLAVYCGGETVASLDQTTTSASLPDGSYTYRLVASGYFNAEGSFTVSGAAQTVSFNVALRTTWDGSTVTAPQQENGIYQITCAEELVWFAQQVTSGQTGLNAILLADIYINDETSSNIWTPIGSYSNQYAGTFDGNDKAVRGLTDTLFGYNGNGSLVKNVTVYGSVSGSSNVGGVCNASYGSFAGCTSYMTVTATGQRVGGIVGILYSTGSVSDCANYGSVSSSCSGSEYTDSGTAYAGGIVGYAYGPVSGCVNTAAVTDSGVNYGGVGGIAGVADSTLTNSYNTGTVQGCKRTGGIVGIANAASSSVSNCYNIAAVSVTSTSDNPFCGAVAGSVNNSNGVTVGMVVNTYYLTGTAANAIGYGTGDATAKTNQEMRDDAFAVALGSAFNADSETPINDGYPVLTWQGGRTPSAGQDAEDVAADKAALTLTPNVIRQAMTLTLPSTGANGSAITWSSSNPDVISDKGLVTLPTSGSVEVTMTATLTKGTASDTKTFIVTVYSQTATTQEELNSVMTVLRSMTVLTPVYGTDTNIVDYVKALAVAALSEENLIVNSSNLTVTLTDKGSNSGGDMTAHFADDGTITYFYRAPESSGMNVGIVTGVGFTLSCGDVSEPYTAQVNLPWDVERVQQAMQPIVNGLSFDTIKNENTSADAVTSDLTLPASLEGYGWATITWASGSSTVSVVAGSTPLDASIGVVEPAEQDTNVTLTATVTFNLTSTGEPEITLTKTIPITVTGAQTNREREMETVLAAYTMDKLTDFVNKQPITPNSVTGDIQLLTPKKLGIDGGVYSLTVTANNSAVTVNGYRAYVNRPLPGSEPVQVQLTVTLTHKSSSASKQKLIGTITVQPLQQAEIDAELSLMQQVKAAYFEGIRGENTSADAITRNLHAFQEVYLRDGELVWVYNYSDRTGTGIIPTDIPKEGYDESYNLFHSSQPTIIQHENLLLKTVPEVNTQVTITSCLTSQGFARYAELYPENTDLQKLANQMVSVTVTVRGNGADQVAANQVADLIDAIGEVTLDSKNDIAAARAAYDALTDAQKALVPNYDKLVAAEEAYKNLVAAAEQDAADRKAARAVIDLINRIGEPVTLDDEAAILAARRAYNQLTDVQKALVENYSKLTAAEQALNTLKNNKGYQKELQAVLAYILKTVDTPSVKSVAGEWAVLAEARGETEAPAWYDAYTNQLAQYLKAHGGSMESLTDYVRAVLALTSVGVDATKFQANGTTYNLVAPLTGKTGGVYDAARVSNTCAAFALIALDTNDYLPNTDARQGLTQFLLTKQLSSGAWGINEENPEANVDATAMVLQALAPYSSDAQVSAAIDKALNYLSSIQGANGGYGSAEADAQVVVALSALQIDCTTDSRFTKSGNPLTSLLGYAQPSGGFVHDAWSTTGENQMSTEQAAYALVAYWRFDNGRNRLYDMSDARDLLPDGSVQTVVDMIEALGSVTDCKRETYLALRAIQSAYDQLSESDRKLVTNYNEFEAKQKQFALLLDAYRQSCLNELERAFRALNSEDYTAQEWKQIQQAYANGRSAILQAQYAEQADRALDAAKRALTAYAENNVIYVSFRLIGDTPHDGGVDGHEEYVTWIPTTTYTLTPGDTVYDVFTTAITDYRLSQKGASENYVTSIRAPEELGDYWLGEMDNGKNAGWMYTVNGSHPDVGLKDCVLSDGDTVIWHYVDDYTKEVSGAYKNRWLEASNITPAEYVRRNMYKIVTVDGNGKVEPELKQSNIGHNVTFTFLPEDGYRIKDVLVDGTSQGAIESYTYKNLTIGSRIKVVFEKQGEMRFQDVTADDWFYSDVLYVVENGLFNGTSDATFSPNTHMTRAMLVTVLYRLEGRPEVSSTSSYTDVKLGQWYTDAVIWATENKIVNGYGNGKFGTTDSITREQIAAILYRYAQYKNYSVKASNSLTGYRDYAQISAYALQPLKWANAEGLINGRTRTTLVPQGTATRAEVAAILHRFVENVVNAD